MTTPATPAVPPAQDEWLKEATRLADEAVCLGTPHKTNVAYAALLSHLAVRPSVPQEDAEPGDLTLKEWRACALQLTQDIAATTYELHQTKSMFGAAVASLAEISEALGIDEEEAACANGNELILEAIARKNEALLLAIRKDRP